MANKHIENLVVNITIHKRNANQNHNKTNRLTDLENKVMVSNGEWEAGRNKTGLWDKDKDYYLCIKQKGNKDILNSTQKYSYYF